ncbi:hypothetical protein GOODEAATRI_022995 [Goodea atripinnis]|uniref:Uncharacterized protein n=1 Tax=Goodea atripinnis TaxID=208336 RepID=A0ABV0NMV7_9TELE
MITHVDLGVKKKQPKQPMFYLGGQTRGYTVPGHHNCMHENVHMVWHSCGQTGQWMFALSHDFVRIVFCLVDLFVFTHLPESEWHGWSFPIYTPVLDSADESVGTQPWISTLNSGTNSSGTFQNKVH